MNYFLAPASNEKSYQNFLSTIVRGVPYRDVQKFLDDEGKRKLMLKKVLHVWGNRDNTYNEWELINQGDVVLFYARGRIVAAAEVIYKHTSEPLARKLWEPDKNGELFKHIFYMKDLRTLSIPRKALAIIGDYKSLDFFPLGFRHVAPERIYAIEKHFGSVEEFLGQFTYDPSSNAFQDAITAQHEVLKNFSPEVATSIAFDQPSFEGRRSRTKSRRGRGVSNELYEKDILTITNRRAALKQFEKLLYDPSFFEEEKKRLQKRRPEDIWQNFFEENVWIFGYGLQLVACQTLDERKLETIVVGADIIDRAGKRSDALMKTKGNISRFVFAEIKLPSDPLVEAYDRPAVFVPGKALEGAMSQVEKTIHKVTLKVNQNIIATTKRNGDPTGERIAYVRPRGIVIIGKLSQFNVGTEINDEKFASFELYRQRSNNIEVLTYDELYDRVRFILGDS